MAVNWHCSSVALTFVLLLLLLRPTLAEDGKMPPVDTDTVAHGGFDGSESVDEGIFSGDYPDGPDYMFPPLGDVPGFVEPPGGVPPLPPLPEGASYVLPPLGEMEAGVAREAALAKREQEKEGQGNKNASQATNPSLLLLLAALSSLFFF